MLELGLLSLRFWLWARFRVCVAWWHSCQVVGLATPKVAGSTPVLALSGNNLGQVVHAHVPLSSGSKFGTGQEAVTPCDGGGNRRSGVALAMRRRLQWFIHLLAHGLRKGDEHPAYTILMVYRTLYLYL